MSIVNYLFPAGNFAQIRANAPNQSIYNIEATRDLVKNQPAFMAPFAPAAAATLSLPYDFIQASGRARDKFFEANPTSFGIDNYGEVPIGPSFSDLTKAVAAENPLKSLAERTYGATLGLADKMNLTSGKAAPSDAFDYFNNDFFNQNRSGILETDQAQNIISATPIFASQDIAARNVGVPQDNRFTGIMRNIARPLMFQGGAKAGLTAGEILTGKLSLPFALAGGIASQFLPLDRSKPDFDYQYVNNPDNMGGLSVVDNKIVDPSGILSGKNFESAFGSKNLGEMYDKEISRLGGFITDLEEEEEKKGGLSKKDAARLERLQTKQQIARNRLQDYLSSGPTIPGTNITRAQFARDYNIAQQNIGSDYDSLDAQSYSSLGGGEQTTTVDGQDITSYTDPYDRGTDD